MNRLPVPLLSILTAGLACAYDSVVVFNEVHYHPTTTQQEFIELRNLNGVDINLDGWALTGGADFKFPAGTIIPGHGYLAVGNVPGAVGALSGFLSNGGETLRLRNRNGRIMDELSYSDTKGWPEGADGSGFSMVRLQADATAGPAAWGVSRQRAGSPGEVNFLVGGSLDRTLIPSRSLWKYSDAGTAPPASWKDPGFNDSTWTQAGASFGSGASATPVLTVTADLVARYRAGAITGAADGATPATWPDGALDDGVAQDAIPGTSNPTLRTAVLNGRPVMRFDGNDEMRTSLSPGIAPTSGFCYWMVVKANAVPTNGLVTDGSGTYLFDRNAAGGGIGLLALKAVGGRFGIQKRFDTNTGLGGPVSLSSISQTAWQIVTVRRNRTANRFELWVNGVLEGSEADPGGALTPSPLNIARYSSGTVSGFNGDIAEVLVFRNELSAADFQAVGVYLESEYALDTAFPGTAITTPISAAAPVSYFRRTFNYAGSPELSTLRLDTTAADGTVFYLNGTELTRINMPAGPVDHTTQALTAIPIAATGPVTVPATALRAGANVLTASLHKAAGSAVSYFDATLAATETAPDPAIQSQFKFNEISAGSDPSFFVELRNASNAALDTAGWTILDNTGRSAAVPPQVIPAGALFTVPAVALNFIPAVGDKLFVISPGGSRLTDAREVTGRHRGLTATNEWGHPPVATPGTANIVPINPDIVINEIFYHALKDGPEQWIELYNKGTAAVDLSGWKLSEAVSWLFPPGTSLAPGGYLVVAWNPTAFAALHPGKTALGPWTSNLSFSGERILLRDAADNIVDDVTYGDGGRWSEWADGGGRSLELKDPRADNTNPGAWDSSDETQGTPWKNYTITGTGAHATTSSLTYYNELLMGLLDTGEILIDDISLKEVNVGNRELIQNGTFTGGTTAAWRHIGSHRLCSVVDDPFTPGEKVLRLTSTGGTEHMNNNCGTTLKAGAAYVSLNTASTYTLTFRAKWLRGSNRLHTRLYFNRLSRQTQLDLPATGGTPGAINSRSVPNAGPTLSTATATPPVPAVSTASTVSLTVSDPDGISAVDLFTSINGGAFSSAPMTAGSGGIYTATVPGQTSGTKVQFYVRATDTAGASSQWPAAGPDSRAMIPWQDGNSQFVMPNGGRPHNMRVVMTGADANSLYRAENVQSNEYVPCTVIVDDTRAWYEAGTRLKSSEHGRFQANRVGYNLKFGSDAPFLGAHETISIDRSGNKTSEGLDGSTITSQREILIKAVMNSAGGIYSMEDDLIRVIPPIATGTPAPLFTGAIGIGEAILSKSRFDDEYLDGQWDRGGSGPIFKQEYIYPLTQTIHPTSRVVSETFSTGNLNITAEQPKIPQTGGSPGPSGISVQAYAPPAGTDPKENYRWHWLIRNARGNDDYTGLIAAITAVGQANAANFKTQTTAALDVDTWLRAAVPAKLFGVVDNYLARTGDPHNFLLYFPPGGKGVAIPWDFDFLGQSDPAASITDGGDIAKFIVDGANRRRFYGHVLDILNRSFNDTFLTRWATHYSTFGVDDMTSSLGYLRSRATFVRSLVTGTNGRVAPIAVVPFRLTSPASVNVTTPFATIIGDGWIDVDTIRLAGSPLPLAVTWTDDNSWSAQVPLYVGTRLYTLEALRPDGTLAGTVSVTVTSTSGITPAAADNLVFSKIHYHPPNPTLAESTAGWLLSEDFEYLELQNIGPNIVDLTNCRFDAGIAYAFAPNTQIPVGGRLILPRRAAAFALRHPGVATAPEFFQATDPTGNKLSDGGETLAMVSAAGLDIKRFSYRDSDPWPAAADGGGSALVLIAPLANPLHADPLSWRSSTLPGGTPGAQDGNHFTGDLNADLNQNGRADFLDFALGSGTSPSAILTGAPAFPVFQYTMERDTSAMAAASLEISTTLTGPAPPVWTPANALLLTRTPLTGPMESITWAVFLPPGTPRCFIRSRFTP
jgi:Lamin Tail Domain/Concanavalin A-like lectin/glucanases superfamily/CotH kinase protein